MGRESKVNKAMHSLGIKEPNKITPCGYSFRVDFQDGSYGCFVIDKKSLEKVYDKSGELFNLFVEYFTDPTILLDSYFIDSGNQPNYSVYSRDNGRDGRFSIVLPSGEVVKCYYVPSNKADMLGCIYPTEVRSWGMPSGDILVPQALSIPADILYDGDYVDVDTEFWRVTQGL